MVHSGFGVYCGKRINTKDARSTENLARYIIRASFSKERMKYYPGKAKVTYRSKYGKQIRKFSSLEWMAALVCHIQDRGGRHYVKLLVMLSKINRKPLW